MKYKAVLHFIVMACILLSAPAATGNEEDSAASFSEDAARQLRIYRDTLLQGSSEDLRVDAAVGLLLRNDPTSREVLVSALKSTDNPQARQAVCKGLIKSRGLVQTQNTQMVYLVPLIDILKTESGPAVALASEALLIYEYQDVTELLNGLVSPDENFQQVRLNGIYALKLRSDQQALRALIGLLEDHDPEIVKAAETALQDSFGIPVGTSHTVWEGILKELQQKSPRDIRRDRLLRQEMRLREVLAERDRWQKLYLEALNKQYQALDEAGQEKMISEMFNSDQAALRLWALNHAGQFPIKPAGSLRDKLLTLLGDADRDVRIKTAEVLINRSDLDPAKALLERFKIESEPDVALAMFKALGEACFFAFSPGSKIVLDPQIKTETLDIATNYLNQRQTAAAKEGARVVRKILQLNNLTQESLEVYLGLLAERYERAVSESAELRSDLLDVMAQLCGQGSPKVPAGQIYEKYFVEALSVSDNPALRLAGAKGLVYVDKVRALEIFKQNKLTRDESTAVRQVVVDLAGQTGTAEDLDWLLPIAGSNNNGSGDYVWQAIKSIAQRQTSEFLLSWTWKLKELGVRADRILEIMQLAEQKALGEKDTASLELIRRRIITIYVERKSWEQGAAYLEKLAATEESADFLKTLSLEMDVDLFYLYLWSGNSAKTSQLIQNKLLKEDIANPSEWIDGLNAYFSEEAISREKKLENFSLLIKFKIPDRPKWDQYIADISNRLNLPDPAMDVSPIQDNEPPVDP